LKLKLSIRNYSDVAALLGFVVSILKQICLLSGALYSEFAVILVVGYVLLPGAKTIIFKKNLPGNALGQV
jgi:hypothetical protein